MVSQTSQPAATPAGSARPAVRRSTGLRHIERRAFTGPAAALADPERRSRIERYFTDLAGTYGRELTAPVTGQSYSEMAAALLTAPGTAAAIGAAPVDLLALAFAVPDVEPGRAAATYLSHVCPGTPMAFAVCDQGSGAAFTALRIAGAYAARRVMVLVVEQAELPYAVAGRMPAASRGAALLVEGMSGVVVRQQANVPPDRVATVARAEVERAARRPSPAVAAPLVLLSGSLAEAWPDRPAAAVVAAADQPSTGVWWRLADDFPVAGPAVVADYDPDLGLLSVARFA